LTVWEFFDFLNFLNIQNFWIFSKNSQQMAPSSPFLLTLGWLVWKANDHLLKKKRKQGKKVCKATAVRCFCLLASRRSDRVIWSPERKQLQWWVVNSADRCKNMCRIWPARLVIKIFDFKLEISDLWPTYISNFRAMKEVLVCKGRF